MIRSVLYDPGEKKLHEGGAELIDRWEREPATSIWVLIRDEDPAVEAALLADRFKIHRLAINDALRLRHPPKFESFDDCLFVLLKGLDAAGTSLHNNTIQLSMFIGDRFLITRSSGHSVSSEKVFDAVVRGEIPPDSSRAALALKVCRTVADRFVPLLMTVEDRLDEMEEELLERADDELLAELVRQEGGLKRMLRVLQYDEQVFREAQSHQHPRLGGHHHELNDVQEQLDRLLGLTRLYYELTDNLLQGYLSLSAHRLNRIMQTLTIVTVIFVPITFMAGIYGMNFEHMPELRFPGAYYALLGAMVLVVSAILGFLYKRGWLGSGKGTGTT